MGWVAAADNGEMQPVVSVSESPIRRFLQWWGGELRASLPDRLRNQLFPAPTRVEVAIGPDHLSVSHCNGRRRGRTVEILREPGGAGAAMTEMRSVLGRTRADEVVLRLPADRVLDTTFQLPAIAGGALDEVVAQEMDRKTPFSANEVFFDYRVAADHGRENLTVRLRVARRSDVQEAVAVARGLGLEPTRVDGEERLEDDYNLLPRSERPRASRLIPRLVGIAALVAAVLGAAALYLAFDRAAGELRLIEAELERERARASEVLEMRAHMDAMKAAASALGEARGSRVIAAELIDEVTRRVADGDWLFEMRYRDGDLYLFGFSRAPTQLLRSLEGSPILSGASFAAPLVSGEDEADRVTIRATVGRSEPEGVR